MELVPLTDEELSEFIRSAAQQYAEQKSSMGSVPEAEAIRQAEQESARMFPGGSLRPGHQILKLVDDDGVPVGRVWLAPHEAEPGLAFVYDVQVSPEQRGKGYGRAIMQLAHDWARSAGYTSIGLHVFGRNEPAINLYKSLGYEVTDISMRRDL